MITNDLPSRHQIGQSVILQVAEDTYVLMYVKAISFGGGKVRYDLFSAQLRTTFKQVDSSFVSDVPAAERDTMDFPSDVTEVPNMEDGDELESDG